jgi:hypothetical protein
VVGTWLKLNFDVKRESVGQKKEEIKEVASAKKGAAADMMPSYIPNHFKAKINGVKVPCLPPLGLRKVSSPKK